MSFSVKTLWKSIRNAFRAMSRGELVLAWISILLSLKVDQTLTRVEENKKDLRDLEVYHAEKEAELVRLHSASTTAKRLKELGSDVALPEKPAVKLD